MGAKDNINGNESLLGNISIVAVILGLHVALIAGLAVLVMFLQGMHHYLLLIVSMVLVIAMFVCLFFYKQIKKRKVILGELLNSPLFKDKAIEISVLNGLATIKIDSKKIPELEAPVNMKIEDQISMRIRKLAELSALFQDNKITLDEYNKTKEELFKDHT